MRYYLSDLRPICILFRPKYALPAFRRRKRYLGLGESRYQRPWTEWPSRVGTLESGRVQSWMPRLESVKLSLLDNLESDALDAGAQRLITLELPNGMIFDMTGERYARDWALAQFYFHLMTAYAILRSRNIELGKADYVPHMLAYLRPGSTLQS